MQVLKITDIYNSVYYLNTAYIKGYTYNKNTDMTIIFAPEETEYYVKGDVTASITQAITGNIKAIGLR